MQTQKPLCQRLALLALLTLCAQLSPLHAQGTAFSYQGRLNAGGAAANGLYDFRFRLAADPLANTYVGNAYLTNAIGVTNGLFVTTVDFGSGLFAGSNYWLEVDVRTNGTSSYTALAPVQSLTPTPYAIFATGASNLLGVLPATQLSGTVASGNLPASPIVSGTVTAGAFAGNGAAVTAVNAASLNGLNATNFWQLGGNNTLPGQFLGTTNSQAVELRVNGYRALRLEPTTNNSPNFIAGWSNNVVAAGAYGDVILGGGSSIAFPGQTNAVAANYSTIAGGGGNTLNPTTSGFGFSAIGGGLQNALLADFAVIGGGQFNAIWQSSGSVIGGGSDNIIGENYSYNTIAGGTGNVITNAVYGGAMIGGGVGNTNSATYGTIGGGVNNLAGLYGSVVGGGGNNTATNTYATVPGGNNNVAGGRYSLAAGQQAQALHNGSFVWADAETAPFASTKTNQFDVRANGGVQFVTGGAGMTLDGNSVLTTASTVMGGTGNTANGGDSFVGGGVDNNASGYASFVGGGGDDFSGNTASGDDSVVVGGTLNLASGYESVIMGGNNNKATNDYAIIGGGANNIAGGYMSTIGGGAYNVATNNYATIPGGLENQANGQYSFAAGSDALALHDGTFVWADSQGTAFASTVPNQFNVRAGGGVRFVTGGAGMTLDGQPVLASGSGISVQTNTNGGPNLINGAPVNWVAAGIIGATISGGGATNVSSLFPTTPAFTNSVTSYFGTVGGGAGNSAGLFATVAGGELNMASGPNATVGGGSDNFATGQEATIAGGESDTASGFYATVGGGAANQATNNYATVPGGYENLAGAPYTFAAGREAQATNQGAFVWADSQNAAFPSTNSDSFNVRAQGGARFVTTGAGLFVDGQSVFTGRSGATLTNLNASQLISIGSGTGEFFLGTAGNTSVTGPYNTGSGLNALASDTTGADNTATGSGVLHFNTSGSDNTAFGYNALHNNGAGPGNTAVGSGALSNHSSGTNNIAIGFNAGSAITTTSSNIDIGNLGLSSDNNVIRIGATQTATYLAGTVYANGVALTSDRNAKENFTPLNQAAILDRVLALPVTEWNYKSDAAAQKHIGPMAQDFHAAFGLNGGDDKHISVVDESGIALAAIQGLNQKLEEQKAENAQLKQQLAQLQALVQQLVQDRK